MSDSENYQLQTPAESSVDEINAHTYKFRNWIAAAFGGLIILYFMGLFTWKVFVDCPGQIAVINQVLNDSTKLLGPILGYCIAFITKNDS